MILPVIYIFLSTAFGDELYAGDHCSLSNGTPGVCTNLNNCPIVRQQVLSGIPVDTQCGFEGFDSIVCCPPSSPPTTAAVPEVRVETEGDGRGAIARQKCAEYAQYVWVLEDPVVLIGDPQPINVSKCAIKSQKLIVGGTKAERMEFPHMAALGYVPENEILWRCGGSLISENFILTAAHCIAGRELGLVQWVRVGDLNLIQTDDGAEPVDRRVAERIRHPQYKPPSEYHDIALLRLESRVPFNAWIRPACLHTAPTTGTTKVIATGWGHIEWGEEEGSNDLLKVTIPIVNHETCNRTYTANSVDLKLGDGIFGDRMICAGQVGKDTCQGDSGGPIVIYSEPEYYCMYDIVGVTSFGRLCGSILPTVCTRVYYYLPWIESVVWGRE